MSNTTLTQTQPTGTRPYVRALATVQGYCWSTVDHVDDGDEQLVLQEAHDRVSDEYFKRADDELAIALDLIDVRLIKNHIRASMNLRADGYRFEAYEDERRDRARASLTEARAAGLAGSQTCDAALRRDGICSGQAA